MDLSLSVTTFLLFHALARGLPDSHGRGEQLASGQRRRGYRRQHGSIHPARPPAIEWAHGTQTVAAIDRGNNWHARCVCLLALQR
jgi:hypothetical protein